MKTNIKLHLEKFHLKKHTTIAKNKLLANAKSVWKNEIPIFSDKVWIFFKVYACGMLILLFVSIILINNENQQMRKYATNYRQTKNYQTEKVIKFFEEFNVSYEYSQIAAIIKPDTKKIDLSNFLKKRKQLLTLLQNGEKL